MKIAYITAGAGNMYCGSCLRDNTLADAMMKAGHDVTLIPTYTPTRTDEPNVSLNRVFLGGINVFLQHQFPGFSRAPGILTRFLDSPALLRFMTKWGVSVDPARLGRLTVSMLLGARGHLRGEIHKLVRFLAVEVVPDLISIPNSLLISLAPAIKAVMNVPICCAFQGEDLFLDSLGEPYRRESLQLIREHSLHVDAFVAVSRFGARQMARYLEIDPGRVQVVPLGINFNGFVKTAAAPADPFTIGYLARIAPEKGLHLLCEAYRKLRACSEVPPSRLWAAGYLAPEHKPYLAGIQKNMQSWGLSSHFRYHGELTRKQKIDFLGSLHLFSVPGPYPDPKGLFLLEAMAGGIPVVQPRSGAFTEIVETAGGGILVEPGDPQALAEGILDLWKNPARRLELGAKGYEGVRTYYSSARMSERAMQLYDTLLKRKAGCETAAV